MHILDNELGQSAMEFVLTIAFAMGVTFLFVNQSLNLTAGYFAHYVNFMAARTYSVHETGVDSQETNITESSNIARQIISRSQLKAFGVDGTFTVVTRQEGSALFSGTVLQFEKSISALPIVGGREKALFYSESLLGKEPTRIICQQMVCGAMTGSPGSCQNTATSMDVVLYDNGC